MTNFIISELRIQKNQFQIGSFMYWKVRKFLWRIKAFYHLDDLTVIACASCARSREFESQRPAKSYTGLQTVRHRFNIYASCCVALALWCADGYWAPQSRYTLRRNTARNNERSGFGLVFDRTSNWSYLLFLLQQVCY